MNSDFTVVFNEYMPLRELVFTTLRQAILKGELQPGERLMEIQLAEKMGVSRTPIREAIRKLEKEGLVTMIPRRGAEVAAISEKMLQDVLQVRVTLEVLAYKLAFDNMTDNAVSRLEEAETKFAEAIESGSIVEMATADEAFHFVIYDMADNDKLREVLNNLKENMYRYRMEYLKDQNARAKLIMEHQEIIRSLKEKDREKGLQLIEEHISGQETSVLDKLKQEEEEKKESAPRRGSESVKGRKSRV